MSENCQTYFDKNCIILSEKEMEQVNTHNLYEDFQSKDKKFNGKIFVGIKTTEIYSRTVCTARVPKKENWYYFRER